MHYDYISCTTLLQTLPKWLYLAVKTVPNSLLFLTATKLVVFHSKLIVFAIKLIVFAIKLIVFAIKLIVFATKLIVFAIKPIAFATKLTFLLLKKNVFAIKLTLLLIILPLNSLFFLPNWLFSALKTHICFCYQTLFLHSKLIAFCYQTHCSC